MNEVENNKLNKKNNDIFIDGIIGCGLISVLIILGLLFGLIYVVVHFVAKIW
jgi:F0F1-type ATP synthase membrane subunit c/vacuolar-type H+-ATPase subunit K